MKRSARATPRWVGWHPAVALLAAAAALSGCAPLRPRRAEPLAPVSDWQLPDFADDLDAASLRAAVERTIPAYGGDGVRTQAARELVAVLDRSPEPGARRAALRRVFRVVRVRDPLLLTAYYEPELRAHRTRDRTFRYPIYSRPPDLVDADPGALDPACACRRLAGRVDGARLVPYPSRADIDAGALGGRGLELAWTDDPVALFLLHVQGSGWLRLKDGSRIGVRYAGTNGRPFQSLARILVARGLLAPEDTTVPAIRRVLDGLGEPERAAILAANPRYVFFRATDAPATGSLGVELTPGRAIATDPRVVPLGTLAYLATASVRRFVVSQDTGAAIVGAHADLFLGTGADAEAQAGRTRERGTLYLLLPR